MGERQQRLNGYRRTVVEVWIGYGLATAGVLLWSGANSAPWLILAGTYFALLIVGWLGAVALIERRRPWFFGARARGEAPPKSLGYVGSLFVFVLIGGLITLLEVQIGQVAALMLRVSLVPIWLTVSVFVAPVRAYIFPSL